MSKVVIIYGPYSSFCTFYSNVLKQPLRTKFGIFQCFTDSNKPSYLKFYWFMIHSVFNQLFMKILIQLNLLRLGQKKVVMFPRTGQLKFFLSLIRPHSRMCIRIYIFNFKKQTDKQKQKRKKEYKKSKRN